MSNHFLDSFQHQDPQPRSRWDTVAAILTALAAIVSVSTQSWSHPVYATAFLVIAALLFASMYYRPVAVWNRTRRLHARRNRVARKEWPDFLHFEKRFAEFINNNDHRNLRMVINGMCGQRNDQLEKICPPDYINSVYPLLSSRHAAVRNARESDFRFAVTELVGMVVSYNTEYVLNSERRLVVSPQVAQLIPSDKKQREGEIEAFRERWVRFLDDLMGYVSKRNNEFGYEQSHEALYADFERPKKLSL